MGNETPEEGIRSAEELYQMVSREVPVLEDFRDDFCREASGYVEHNIGEPVDGLPRYLGEEVDEGVFADKVGDAAKTMGFMRVRDRQLEDLVQELEDLNQYRVFNERGFFRGVEARSGLQKQRVRLASVNSDIKAISGVLDGVEDVPYNPLQESNRIFNGGAGFPYGPEIADEMEFQRAVDAYWPFDSELQ
ncbi:MAG: hypothetical protein ABEJ36_01170 [Candidatus Nanosalina sp.]